MGLTCSKRIKKIMRNADKLLNAIDEFRYDASYAIEHFQDLEEALIKLSSVVSKMGRKKRKKYLKLVEEYFRILTYRKSDGLKMPKLERQKNVDETSQSIYIEECNDECGEERNGNSG